LSHGVPLDAGGYANNNTTRQRKFPITPISLRNTVTGH
jgi:hypothetical protein